MKLRWLGPGVKHVGCGENMTVAFPGDLITVDREQGEEMIAQGTATANLLQRVHLYDIDHPAPSRQERQEVEQRTKEHYKVTTNIIREHRLHPHNQNVRLSPVPVEE